jgi:hypothetical protein
MPQIMVRENLREEVKAKAHDAAEERVIEAWPAMGARDQTREMFRKKLRSGRAGRHDHRAGGRRHVQPDAGVGNPGQPPEWAAWAGA